VKLVVGLGNPGRQYARTRHNVGWLVVDHLADAWRCERWTTKGKAQLADGAVAGQRVRLLKPQTFMNLSGDALIEYRKRPTWSPATDLLVVVDDFALPTGRLRLRADGSHGGHNGLRSIEQQLGSRAYARLRVGVQPPEDRRSSDDPLDYVLGPFSQEEARVVTDLLPTLTAAAECWLRDGITAAMNRFNGPSPVP
jgi:PTH1 family peptidyl-tRNA hydrolase